MTSYHGGKQKIGKEIASVIVEEALYIAKDSDFKINGYCEPFCGMLGVYRHVPKLFKDEGLELTYKAGDMNKSVIMMWNESQKGWTPPSSVNEERFLQLKLGDDCAEKGFVCHQYSFRGQWCKPFVKNYGKISDFPRAVKNVKDIGKELEEVEFSFGDYNQYSNLKNYVIYCDPPYNNYSQYYGCKFNSDKFYNWCREMSKNNIVFVSEYSVPDDFTEIWGKSTKVSGNKIKNHIKRTEKLFLIKN
jgi:DNA adenine methylase